ncbi:MAG: HAD family hydrolase [Alphaproteobacteria bacterium]|nr:HAD family hydrolase [Alphaproteobacteria bacterium]MBU1756443.1 HAD family hydrolase [Alphaproteobacteria bacterium]MBU2033199.1 HAD family hydrolase [Alphaproteobacteria bacterium]
MNRPLVISDCDEVLLHMVAHFRDWLNEETEVDFDMQGADFTTAMRWRGSGEPLEQKDIWRYLGRFFDTQMDRQLPILGAIEGINTLAEKADVVILTNLTDERQLHRVEQLAKHGLDAKVYTNQGPKGPALQRILAEYEPSRAIFIDDLPQHHQSARETLAGDITTLHLCGEPALAPHIACAHQAGHADARIDDWASALPWLLDRIEGKPA